MAVREVNVLQKNSVIQTLRRYWLLWVPPFLLLLAILFYPQLLLAERFAAEHIFFCPFYEVTGKYCPGCGGTRSLTALLHGYPLLALHENPAVPVLLLFLLLSYAEHVGLLFGRQWKLYPRSRTFWYILLGLWLTWAVLRNFIPVLMPSTPPA